MRHIISTCLGERVDLVRQVVGRGVAEEPRVRVEQRLRTPDAARRRRVVGRAAGEAGEEERGGGARGR